ncbi:MAG: cytochrome c, partial [Myxococcota bacterium]
RFDRLTEARDHVVQGRLDAAKTAVTELSAQTPPEGIPKAWRKSLDDVRRESRRAARAKDLVAAARGTAEVAQACGECHASVEGGPPLRDLPPQEWDEGQNMVLHKWASDWMWLGLVSADEAAWQRGVTALTGRPLEMVFTGARPPTDQPQLEQLVYILADQAKTTAPNYRGEVMGQLLATCSECHVRERDAKP